MSHLLRVAIRIMTYYRVSDADVICAALLHDAVEDHAGSLAPGGGQREALDAIANGSAPRVAELVGAVTNPQFAPGPTGMAGTASTSAESLDANRGRGSSKPPTSPTTVSA